ncbi:MAG: putative transcriptional regulator [Frankiales bacterium]|nr:putative transcriptional regulator [Frankiales bacterium]
MRRISLTADQANAIGAIFSAQRKTLGLTTRTLSLRSGVNQATIVRLEHGEIRSPQPDTYVDLARALGIPTSDLFASAGWIPAEELPAFKPYLRAKYRDLDEQAIADLERYADQLSARHGGHGPLNNEDELP